MSTPGAARSCVFHSQSMPSSGSVLALFFPGPLFLPRGRLAGLAPDMELFRFVGRWAPIAPKAAASGSSSAVASKLSSSASSSSPTLNSSSMESSVANSRHLLIMLCSLSNDTIFREIASQNLSPLIPGTFVADLFSSFAAPLPSLSRTWTFTA